MEIKKEIISIIPGIITLILLVILDSKGERHNNRIETISDDFSFSPKMSYQKKSSQQAAFLDSLNKISKLDSFLRFCSNKDSNFIINNTNGLFDNYVQLDDRYRLYIDAQNEKSVKEKASRNLEPFAIAGTSIAVYKISNKYAKADYEKFLKNNIGLSDKYANNLANDAQKIASDKRFKAVTISISATAISYEIISSVDPKIPLIVKALLSFLVYIIVYFVFRYLQVQGFFR